MNKARPAILFIILLFGAYFIGVLCRQKKSPPLSSTFTSLFQVVGKPFKYTDIAVTKILPINQMDEKDYGDEMAQYFYLGTDTGNRDYKYLNKLIKNMSQYAKKPFNYRVFLVPDDEPNAFALPGGIICVTRGLMHNLTTEGEIVSVLGHEMGHIENGHCLSDVKFEILSRKIEMGTLGQLADFTTQYFLRHTFSKNQENEADEYGYQLILQTQYDPDQFSGAFKMLYAWEKDSIKMDVNNHSDIIRDYYMSHPPMQLRISEFSEKSKIWWDEHPSDKRYIGAVNLKNRKPFTEIVYDNEWRKVVTYPVP